MNGFTSFLKATHYDKQDVKRIKVFFLLMIHHLVMNIIILQVDLDILCHLVEFQVNLSTRIVPGALPRVIVVQEAESLHATWVIFDRNAMKEKKMYYSEHLKCHVLRIKSDGCSTETIRSLGPTPGPATFADSMLSASFTSSESSSSTDHSSISNMSHEFSPSIWSRFKSFGSRRSSPVNHQQSVSATSSSTQSSPRTLVLSSTPEDTEYIVSSIPTINDFSFDSPNQKSMLNSATKLKAFYLGKEANIPQQDGAA